MNINQRVLGKIAQRKSFNVDKELFLGYDVVSFDIFDTLLKRNVLHPTDIFSIMEKKVSDTVPNFKRHRIDAEKKARLNNKAGEINLEDIYLSFDGLSKEQIKKLIVLEEQIESEYLTINVDMLPFFDYCIKNKKKVLLISDMYLSKDFICTILEREGVTGYTSIFVSSEYNKTKSSEKLYECVYRTERINKKSWLHIGDSYYSDYYIPRRFGIQAIHIPTLNKKVSYFPSRVEQDIRLNSLYAFVNNHLVPRQEKYYQFGYEKFGMFLWGYVTWLKKSFDEKGIKKVYFFSRDGLIMKNAFEILYHNSNIESEYLEVSRRSLRVPVLYLDSRLETLIDMISPSKLISLEMIFDGVGLEIDKYKTLIESFGYTKETVFDRNSILNDKKFNKFYKKLQEEIQQNSKVEYDLLRQFIEEKRITGKFAIVDIGWSGGMQRYLIETLNKMRIENDVIGFYCGVADYCQRNLKHNPDLKLNGYLFDFSTNKDEKDKRSSFVGLFETLFLEQDGSVKKYKLNSEGKVEAVRAKYEYLNEDGTPTYELQAVREIQKGALNFIRDISKISYLDANDFTSDELFYGLKATGTNPTQEELKMFGKFRFFDEGIVNELANPSSLRHYLVRPKNFKSDFLLSRWKTGFLKSLLHLPLSYEKVYDFLYQFK